MDSFPDDEEGLEGAEGSLGGNDAAETDDLDLDDSFFDPKELSSRTLSDSSFDDFLDDSDLTDVSITVFGFITEEAFVVLDLEDWTVLGSTGAGIITAGETLLDDFLLESLLGTSLGGVGSRTSTADSEYLTDDLAFSDWTRDPVVMVLPEMP